MLTGRRNAAVVVPKRTILAQLDRDDYLRVVADGYDALIDFRVEMLRRSALLSGRGCPLTHHHTH